MLVSTSMHSKSKGVIVFGKLENYLYNIWDSNIFINTLSYFFCNNIEEYLRELLYCNYASIHHRTAILFY